MNKCLHKFADISIRYKLELFDKWILPVLNYGSEVWGFNKGLSIERLHTQFCKRLLNVKKITQNDFVDFVYAELGSMPLQNYRYFNIIRYWVKILNLNGNRNCRKIYDMLCNNILLNRTKQNWCSLIRKLLCTLCFHDAWLFQTAGDEK